MFYLLRNFLQCIKMERFKLTNKKILFLPSIILLILFSLSVGTQHIEKTIEPSWGEFEKLYMKEAIVNGHRWNTFKQERKRGYLFGYEDGLITTGIYYISDQEARYEIISSLPTSVGDTPMEDLVDKIDEFYSNDKNLNIPVSYVLLIIRNRLIGVDEKWINEYIEHLRNSFGKKEVRYK